jgi:hypothetical protein
MELSNIGLYCEISLDISFSHPSERHQDTNHEYSIHQKEILIHQNSLVLFLLQRIKSSMYRLEVYIF